MEIRISHPAGFSETGQKENQEDALYPVLGTATPQSRVFLVCDGMGGHEHGEVASACVAEAVGRKTADAPPCTTAEMRQHFEAALDEAYRRLDALDEPPSSGRSMGTTLTFMALCTDGVLVAHIGDSRVYQFRPGAGILFRTRDHSLVSDLIAAGELDEESARTFPQKNIITRAVQPHQENPARASFKTLTDVRKGDVFFLCCDGVIEQLTDDDLGRFLLNSRPLADRLNALRKECGKRSTRDNHSCYAIEVAAESNAVPVSGTASSGSHPAARPRRRWLLVVIVLLALVAGIAYFLQKGDAPSPAPARHTTTKPLRPAPTRGAAPQGTITRTPKKNATNGK